jgi:hypothetical protein
MIMQRQTGPHIAIRSPNTNAMHEPLSLPSLWASVSQSLNAAAEKQDLDKGGQMLHTHT